MVPALFARMHWSDSERLQGLDADTAQEPEPRLIRDFGIMVQISVVTTEDNMDRQKNKVVPVGFLHPSSSQ